MKLFYSTSIRNNKASYDEVGQNQIYFIFMFIQSPYSPRFFSPKIGEKSYEKL